MFDAPLGKWHLNKFAEITLNILVMTDKVTLVDKALSYEAVIRTARQFCPAADTDAAYRQSLRALCNHVLTEIAGYEEKDT